MRPSYIGRITRLVRLSVRPLNLICARNSKTETQKNKIGIDVPHGTSKWSANFQFERSQIKVTGRKNLSISSLLTGGSAGGNSVAGAQWRRNRGSGGSNFNELGPPST